MGYAESVATSGDGYIWIVRNYEYCGGEQRRRRICWSR